MPLPPLMFAVLLQAAPPPPVRPEDDETIVVTAPLSSLQRDYDRCVAGGCTPRQDIVASVRYAEAVFRAGRYFDARRALQKAIGRNRSAAASEPVAIAALYEATTTVALHDGEQAVAKKASGDRLAVLRASFGEDDPRYLRAKLDDIDLRARMSGASGIEADYASIERRARDAGQPAIATEAALKIASLRHADHDDRAAAEILNRLIATPGQNARTQGAAKAMLATFAGDRGPPAATNRLATSVAATSGADDSPPMLLRQPTLAEPQDPATPSSQSGPAEIVAAGRVIRGSDSITAHWVDIAFSIQPDGSVDKVEVLRGNGRTNWAAPIVKVIAARHYSPTTLPAERRRRVERWSLTADYGTPVGSLIRRRLEKPHYVVVDLTEQP